MGPTNEKVWRFVVGRGGGPGAADGGGSEQGREGAYVFQPGIVRQRPEAGADLAQRIAAGERAAGHDMCAANDPAKRESLRRGCECIESALTDLEPLLSLQE